MQLSNKPQDQKSLSTRISKVKKQLEKLSSIIIGDKIIHENTVKALLDCQISSSSQDNSNKSKHSHRNYFPREDWKRAEGEQDISCLQLECERINFEISLDAESKRIPSHTIHQSIYQGNNQSQESQDSTNLQTKHQVSAEIKAGDVTVKKIKPSRTPLPPTKKKEQSQISSSKGSSKLKNVKSEKRFLKKKFVESETNQQKLAHKKFGSPACKISMKEKKNRSENRTLTSAKNRDTRENRDLKQIFPMKQMPLTSVSQTRGLSSKYHLNLKKEVCMKIIDLKVKKMLCQKQSEYLSAAIQITKEEVQRQFTHTKRFSEQSYLKLFPLKSIIRFFTQFTQEIELDQDFDCVFFSTLQNPNKTIKLIMKLPDILRSKNILSEQRCKAFFQEYEFFQQKIRKLTSGSQIKCDIFNTYMVQLHHYIDFLLNNDMVHQTKRRNIFTVDMQEFFSDRSGKEKKNKNCVGSLVPARQKRKQYDTERKAQPRMLKRNNTAKMLSPKMRKVKRDK